MTNQVEIQIIEGILNEDVTAMQRLEQEQKELSGLAQWMGREAAVNMRIWDRVANLNGMWVKRLHSFEWHCRRLQELRGFKMPEPTEQFEVAA